MRRESEQTLRFPSSLYLDVKHQEVFKVLHRNVNGVLSTVEADKSTSLLRYDDNTENRRVPHCTGREIVIISQGNRFDIKR